VARKGWDQLSEAYRNRLVRGGINQQSYEAGASLKGARGHATPMGIGEKTYANLLRLARNAKSWPRDTSPRDFVDTELNRGAKPAWLRERLKQKAADTDEYRIRHNPKPGRAHWDRRQQAVAMELYWYH
jgi:hypothetical protein